MTNVMVEGTKATQILSREDGSQVRITAYESYGLGLKRSVGVYVHRRQSPDHPWELTSDRPHPDWKQMPREDYIRYGRSEMLRTVSHGEIFKVAGALKAPAM